MVALDLSVDTQADIHATENFTFPQLLFLCGNKKYIKVHGIYKVSLYTGNIFSYDYNLQYFMLQTIFSEDSFLKATRFLAPPKQKKNSFFNRALSMLSES